MNRTYILFTILVSALWLCIVPYVWASENTLNIELSGVNDEARKNIIERLNIEVKSYGKKLSEEKIQDFYQNAPVNIHNALQPFGYFKASIQSNLSKKNSIWTASFTIHLGPQIQISHIDIKILGPGRNNPTLLNLLKELPLQPGEPFQTQNYEKAKDALFQTANNEGYIKAYLEKKETRIDPQQNTANIILYFNTGPQYYLGEVTFNENPFSTKFLKRFIPFHRDEPFSSQKLLEFQQALSSSHYFQQVIVAPDLKHVKNYYVPIEVSLTAPKSKQVSFGMGYGTVTGTRFIAKHDFRRITNTGHHFSAELNVSSVLRRLSAKYYIPREKKPLTDQYTIGATVQKFTPSNGNSFSEMLSIGYQKKFKVWHRNISLNFLNEEYNIENQPTKHNQLLYPAINFSRIKADDLLNPHNGSSINLTLQGGTRQIISATNFIQSEFKGKYIFTPFSVGRVILRGDLGYTVVNDVQNLPLTMQYFAGGTDSIRGYSDSKFGPGRYLETGSIEYQHHLAGNWSGAIFYDAGTASNHFGGPYNVGDGFGVIYQSFVGPLRLYFARAEDRENKPWSIEFNIGTDL